MSKLSPLSSSPTLLSPSSSNNNIFDYRDVHSPKEDLISDDYHQFKDIPIIIDNGTYNVRAGYSNENKPRLQFKSLVGKVKSNSQPIVGNSIRESDISRLTLKSPFDSNLLVHPPTQEAIFDYIFERLGVNSSIENPIIITEPSSNPSYCRKYMSELLFECYNIPSLTYGIDSLFAFYGNRHLFDDNGANAMIVGAGHAVTHIYNIQNDIVQHYSTRRINVGSSLQTEYLKRSLHLKYPQHKTFFTSNYINDVKEQHCIVSDTSYIEKLNGFKLDNSLDVNLIQLPFQEVDLAQLEEDKQRKLENKKKMGQMARDKAEQKRKEKMVEYEEQLSRLEAIALLKTENAAEYEASLESESLKEREFLKQIDELREKLGRKREPIPEKSNEEEFPLLFIADDQLSADQLKEKRKQKHLKALKDSRLSAKRKRDEEKEKVDAINKKEEDAFERDPEAYIKDLYERRKKILDRKEAREKARTQVIRRQSKLRSLERKNDDDDPEDAEDDLQMTTIEKWLNRFDPTWNIVEEDDDPLKDFMTAKDFQVRLDVERIKVPEILFQPKALISLDEMGLMETIEMVLSEIKDRKLQNKVASNVFLTGGQVLFKNFDRRLEYELTQLREPGTKFNIFKSDHGLLDSWFGAKRWYYDTKHQWQQHSISQKEFQEYGYDYIKEHFASNLSIYNILNKNVGK
ncbi:actin related protein 5 [Heterostelium album PN500]|uniref:Actin related protein 5 n=1 Tax=Heterostelium pallidum (strain ATCC 26659 / Pp 5 / PN500) TaxID=670386 RepID=D3BJ95_HETP5|nr:actin related protein 5 [Heterostelium album PN500]EFA77975.1 actin related protein 5 [Heterostelium album PN500]|eukprot:XP_020430103.1 actin related protein 5 [Heterostelium album PN500]